MNLDTTENYLVLSRNRENLFLWHQYAAVSLSRVSSLFFFFFFHPHFLVFQHFYHGPTLTTTNSTLVLRQINEVLEKMKNQTANMPGDHNQSVSLMGHAEGHELIFLPESLVLCTRERPILCLLLMLGTLWLGYALYLIRRRYAHLINYFS